MNIFHTAARLVCVFCQDTEHWDRARKEILTGLWPHPPRSMGKGAPCLASVIHQYLFTERKK